MVVGNSFWLYQTIYLVYAYNFTTRLFYFILPTWLLIVESFFAATGIYLGQLILRNKIDAKKYLLVDILLFLTGILIELLVVS